MITIFTKLIARVLTMYALCVAFVRTVGQKLNGYRLAAIAFFAAGATMALAPALSQATETETKVGEVATQVGSEGVTIVLAILAALIGLLVAIIIIPKAVGLIRRFI